MSLSLCRKRRVQGHDDTSTSSINTTVSTEYRSARQRRRDELPTKNVRNEAAAQEDAPICSQAKRQKRSEGTLVNNFKCVVEHHFHFVYTFYVIVKFTNCTGRYTVWENQKSGFGKFYVPCTLLH